MEILASGDVVNINMNGVTVYQAAVGIEIMVLQVMNDNTWVGRIGFTDGAQDTVNYSGMGTTIWRGQIKFGITNTQYFLNTPTVAKSGFSGVQIK